MWWVPSIHLDKFPGLQGMKGSIQRIEKLQVCVVIAGLRLFSVLYEPALPCLGELDSLTALQQ